MLPPQPRAHGRAQRRQKAPLERVVLGWEPGRSSAPLAAGCQLQRYVTAQFCTQPAPRRLSRHTGPAGRLYRCHADLGASRSKRDTLPWISWPADHAWSCSPLLEHSPAQPAKPTIRLGLQPLQKRDEIARRSRTKPSSRSSSCPFAACSGHSLRDSHEQESSLPISSSKASTQPEIRLQQPSARATRGYF